MYIKRDISIVFAEYTKFPVVAIIGPRQSGKTTLVTNTFKNHTYLSLEDPELRSFAQNDPKGFLQDHENKHGIIIDEFQYVPHILSYIQLEVDKKNRAGYFILTGSQNFLMNEKITQSLAGRVGILTLLPFSINELSQEKILPARLDDAILKGGYPRRYEKKIASSVFYRSYIHTYLQRDVRQLTNVGNLQTFQKFMSLCAGRVGQLLNAAEIATNCGISRDTAMQWFSILEASYITFLLKPHFSNFNKRITKTPKFYFYDTGLACALLGIKSGKDLSLSPFRGALFENFIISDLHKQFHNSGTEPALYFWRDQNGRIEVDCLIDSGSKIIPIEIKASQTISTDFFDSIGLWNEFTKMSPKNSYAVYGGTRNQTRDFGSIVGWKHSGSLVAEIENKR
jgi:predicted AAA+ superfamily ATPase